MNQRVKYIAKHLFLVFAAVVFAKQTAFANTVSYTSNFSSISTNFTSPLNFQQFDPAIGTLTSLSINLAANIYGTAQIQNNNAGAQVYAVTIAGALTLTGPQNRTLAAAVPRFASSVRVGGGGGYSIGATASDNQAASFADALTLNAFTGTGNLAADLTGNDQSGFSGPGQTVFSSSASTDGSIGITYTYSSNPAAPATAQEPASLLLAVFGVSGLVCLKLHGK